MSYSGRRPSRFRRNLPSPNPRLSSPWPQTRRGSGHGHLAPRPRRPPGRSSRPRMVDEEEPDFTKMTPEEKIEYNQRRRDRIFG